MPLPGILHLNYETRSVLPCAPEVQPDALPLGSEPGELRRRALYVFHPPVRWEDYIQQVHQHILVLLVPEHRLEPRVAQYVDIPLDRIAVPADSSLCHVQDFFRQI